MKHSPADRAKLDEAKTFAGYRAARINPHSGTMIVLVQSAEAGLEDDPSTPWTTFCHDHANLVCHETQEQALSWMADPMTWCEECAEAASYPGRTRSTAA